MSQRDAGSARALNDAGLRLFEKDDLEGAAAKFRRALQQDMYDASAHNNLGLVLLESGEHYQAAWEFHWAAKLLPSAPQPRANLGVLYEKVGRLDLAIPQYEAVLDTQPTNVVAMRHLARAYVKTNRKDKRLKRLLERLLDIPDLGEWDYWIRGQIIRLGRNKQER